MSPDAQDANEWHWLWEVYVVGLCVAAIVAVALLNHRFPGSVPVAAAALSAIVLAVLAFGRRAARLPELDWRRIVFVGLVIGLWVLGMVASPVAVAAIPAIYPLVFMSLPLSIALVVTSAINLMPLALLLLGQGAHSPNIPMAIAITLIGLVTAPVIGTVITASMRQRKRLAALVEELAASRAESARLSREAGAAAARSSLILAKMKLDTQRTRREVVETLDRLVALGVDAA